MLNLAVLLLVIALVIYIVQLELRIKAMKVEIWNGISMASKAGQCTLKALSTTDLRVGLLEAKVNPLVPDSALPTATLAKFEAELSEIGLPQ